MVDMKIPVTQQCTIARIVIFFFSTFGGGREQTEIKYSSIVDSYELGSIHQVKGT